MDNQILICSSKAQFFHEWTAQLRADEINFDIGYNRLFVYNCKFCGFYHLTSNKKE